MGLIKYRVNEVAKDFGVPNKEISRILSEYKTAPKSHMQVLEDDELDVIFEYMSQHNREYRGSIQSPRKRRGEAKGRKACLKERLRFRKEGQTAGRKNCCAGSECQRERERQGSGGSPACKEEGKQTLCPAQSCGKKSCRYTRLRKGQYRKIQ